MFEKSSYSPQTSQMQVFPAFTASHQFFAVYFFFFLFIEAAMQYFLLLIETPFAVLNQADGKQHCVLLRTDCCPQVYHKKKISCCCCKKHGSKAL